MKDGAAYVLKDDGLTLANGLNQRHLAQACAAWMRDKVEVRSVTRTGFLHGKMSHIRAARFRPPFWAAPISPPAASVSLPPITTSN
jgi:hypothetical protein